MMRRFWVRLGLAVALVVLALAADTFRRAPSLSGFNSTNPKRTHWMAVREKQARKAGRTWRVTQSWVPLRQVSRPARHAVLAAEDAAFYSHEGFDFHEIKEAMERDWKKKKWARGASTISQQLAKNLWLSPRKSIWRKAEEAILTIRLERSLTKDRILELYLNVAEWGPGVFGIEAASKRYLGKSSSDLSAEDGALLAAMLPNPFRLQPDKNPRGVSKRQEIILQRMRRLRWLPAPKPSEEMPAVEEPVAVEPPVVDTEAEEEIDAEVEEAEEVPPEIPELGVPGNGTEGAEPPQSEASPPEPPTSPDPKEEATQAEDSAP
ncbi:MAG: monofunctional biosynthetic peptidoglycan transglycosylase [Nitrospirae bacterium]|nr:monofunctional biosynthetic peptidoglycan transglycosylase [Nitrospirota bacterium]